MMQASDVKPVEINAAGASPNATMIAVTMMMIFKTIGPVEYMEIHTRSAHINSLIPHFILADWPKVVINAELDEKTVELRDSAGFVLAKIKNCWAGTYVRSIEMWPFEFAPEYYKQMSELESGTEDFIAVLPRIQPCGSDLMQSLLLCREYHCTTMGDGDRVYFASKLAVPGSSEGKEAA